MAQTKKNIIDSIFEMLTKFSRTDETRIDETWMSYKVDQVRLELISKIHAATGIIDMSWLSDVSLLTFYKVNRADDWSVTCPCDIAKTTIPQVATLISKDGNLDLGVYSLISACGRYTYYPKRMSQWQYIPSGNIASLFNYYQRINTSLYISTPDVTKLRLLAILLSPEDGYLINSAPVASGSVVSGTVYLVKGGQIFYDGTIYAPNTTFTGTAETTFTGNGTVYLNSQAAAYRETDPYPASGDLIRAIELEILTKEFGIEKEALVDVRNDSVDDAKKTVEI